MTWDQRFLAFNALLALLAVAVEVVTWFWQRVTAAGEKRGEGHVYLRDNSLFTFPYRTVAYAAIGVLIIYIWTL